MNIEEVKSPLEIVVVKDPNGQVLLRHTTSLRNLMKSLSAYQAEVGSYSATAKNNHFKNDFSPLPEILSTINEGYAKYGLTRTVKLCGSYMVSMDYHFESGEFIENWALIPEVDININNYKGVLTSLNRYSSTFSTNMGAEKEEDNGAGTGSTTNANVLWINTPTDGNFIAAEAKIKSGEIKTLEDLNKQFGFNMKPTNMKLIQTKKAKETLENLINLNK